MTILTNEDEFEKDSDESIDQENLVDDDDESAEEDTAMDLGDLEN